MLLDAVIAGNTDGIASAVEQKEILTLTVVQRALELKNPSTLRALLNAALKQQDQTIVNALVDGLINFASESQTGSKCASQPTGTSSADAKLNGTSHSKVTQNGFAEIVQFVIYPTFRISHEPVKESDLVTRFVMIELSCMTLHRFTEWSTLYLKCALGSSLWSQTVRTVRTKAT